MYVILFWEVPLRLKPLLQEIQNHELPSARIIVQCLLYLSTFFQSKLCLMTTGGAPDVTSDGRIVPDKQGDVSAQHRPSAKSARVRII